MASALKKLSLQEIKFLTAYSDTGNASEAARQAGYSKTNAANTSSQLLKRAHMQDALEELQDQFIEELLMTKRRVFQLLSNLASFDPLDVFTETGNLKEMRDIPKDARMAIACIEIEDRSSLEDFVTVKKIKLIERTKSLDMLMRKLGAYEEDNKQKSVTIRVGYGEEE